MHKLSAWADPVKVAKEEGRRIGAQQMRDRACSVLAGHASRETNPDVSKALWDFIHYLETLDTP